jgi:type I restriction enzyme, S subunit
MTDLPEGWSEAALGEILNVRYGKSLPQKYRSPEGRYPVVGSAGRMATTDAPLVRDPVLVIGRKGNIGAVQFEPKGCWPIDTTYFMEIPSTFEPKFLLHQLASLRLQRLDSSTATPSLRRQDLESQPVVRPPVREQRRIVEILEEHLSHLDVADNTLSLARKRLKVLHKSLLAYLIPEPDGYPPSWIHSTVGSAGKVTLGRQRHPDWHSGSNMQPYLRVANVFEDSFDLDDIKQMHWPDGVFERFLLHPGDVLLNEGQSPEWLGRPALYRGEPAGIAFTNTLLRFQASPDVVPEFALLVFRRHMHVGRFARECRITTNIGHLSAARLKAIEFPIPTESEQWRLVSIADQRFGDAATLVKELEIARSRSLSLRRSLFEAAFSGRLTGRSSDMDLVEEMAGV